MVCLVLVCVGVLTASPAVFAQDADALRDTVDALQRQLADVQKQLAELEAQQKETAAAVEAAPAAARPKNSLDVFWKDGLKLETPKNENGVQPFKLKIGGRIQNDWFWGDADSDLDTIGSLEDGTEFRRARIAIGGDIYEDFFFNAQYDFADDASFKDVYMGAKHVPYVGTVKIGHFKEYGSLDELTSSKDIMFIERALPNVFAPSRNVGLGLQNTFLTDDRLNVGVGVFRETDSFGEGFGDDNYAFTGRVTGVPWQSEDGENLVHVGIWGSQRWMDASGYRVRQRPEVHLTPRYLDTFDDIGAVDGVALFGAEAALVYSRYSVMTEYMLQRINRPSMSDLTFQGAYVQVGVFLTKGDHRPYKKSAGIFDKIKPQKNFQFGKDGGWGAWEVAARYSHLDLTSDGVDAGEEDNLTLGVNWFLNPNLRWSLNYVHAWVDRDTAIINNDGDPDEETFPPVDGDFNGVVTRFQVTW
jgi:phosphate-selective porin OprO/OprP